MSMGFKWVFIIPVLAFVLLVGGIFVVIFTRKKDE